MSNPVVFFDVSAGSQPLGRIEMTVRGGGARMSLSLLCSDVTYCTDYAVPFVSKGKFYSFPGSAQRVLCQRPAAAVLEY